MTSKKRFQKKYLSNVKWHSINIPGGSLTARHARALFKQETVIGAIVATLLANCIPFGELFEQPSAFVADLLFRLLLLLLLLSLVKALCWKLFDNLQQNRKAHDLTRPGQRPGESSAI
jgi:uncharacterized membrane protein YtjA (UPF0391 family)